MNDHVPSMLDFGIAFLQLYRCAQQTEMEIPFVILYVIRGERA